MELIRKLFLITVLILIGVLLAGRGSVVQITCREKKRGLLFPEG